MKKYEVVEKKVRVEGNQYLAHFVKGHSNLNAIIAQCTNKNTSDPWANIPDWQVQMYVLRKGSSKWEHVYSGPKHNCPENLRPDKGLYRLLTELEDEPVKRKIYAQEELREAKKDLRDARKRVKTASKELSLK